MHKTEGTPIEGIRALPSFPIVLVTVQNNIMTAAAFHFFSFEPPCVMVGIAKENLTYSLISKEKEFGINLPEKVHLEQVKRCGTVSGRDEDKFRSTGLTPFQGKMIKSSLIAEYPINLECRVVHEIQFEGSHRWFVGEVLMSHIDEGRSRDRALMYWSKEYRGLGEILK